jgi:hypothetical protein
LDTRWRARDRRTLVAIVSATRRAIDIGQRFAGQLVGQRTCHAADGFDLGACLGRSAEALLDLFAILALELAEGVSGQSGIVSDIQASIHRLLRTNGC